MLLITGGVGFIGSHTVVEALRAGRKVVILDNLSIGRREVVQGIIAAAKSAEVTFIEGDCRDAKLVDRVFGEHRIRAVIHFAALKAVRESIDKPLEYHDNNVNGLAVVLAAMLKHGVKDLVFSSSAAVYGTPQSLPLSESHPLSVVNSPYGFSKLVGEKLIGDFVKANPSLRATLLRYFNPVGADASGEIGEFPQGYPNNLVPYLIQVAAGLRDKLTVYGRDYDTPDGTCVRDFIHVSDLAEAHLAALAWQQKQPEGTVDAFNVGTGQGNSLIELIQAFEKVSARPLAHDFGERRAGDVAMLYADVKKIQTTLGWKTKRTLEDAMRSAWVWSQKLSQLAK